MRSNYGKLNDVHMRLKRLGDYPVGQNLNDRWSTNLGNSLSLFELQSRMHFYIVNVLTSMRVCN